MQDLPTTLTTAATACLVGKTIVPVLQVDQQGINSGQIRVCLTLPLNDLVRPKRRIRVSLEDVLTVKFRYDQLLGLCRDCFTINHEPPSPVALLVVNPPIAPPLMVFRGNAPISLSVPNATMPHIPKDKRMITIREVHAFPTPTKITGVRRRREDEDEAEGKRVCHPLVMVPLLLNPKKLRALGFSIVVYGNLDIARTRKSPRKRSGSTTW
ncbi:hypothetical protein ACLB2K_054924 [Fragaria x ananassa]